MEFRFSKSSGLTVQQALSLEWLETNGLGGYASSSIINCNTRKYHGLLVGAVENSPAKYVLLSQLEDSISILSADSNTIDRSEQLLSSHQYPGYFQDGNFSDYHGFALITHPQFNYQFDNIKLQKEILLVHGENTVLVSYKVSGIVAGVAIKLKIRPLLAGRDFHKLTQEGIQPVVNSHANACSVIWHDQLPTLYLHADMHGGFCNEPLWYKDVLYNKEQERGYEFREDLFSPGVFTLTLTEDATVIVSCSTAQESGDLFDKWRKEVKRRLCLAKHLTGTVLQQQLQKVGCSFIQQDLLTKKLAVVAGYHWFGTWGRDTMISLPGLTLYSGLEHECLAILKEFCQYQCRGLLPNILGKDVPTSAYNAVDVSLWFIWAIQQYYASTYDLAGIKKYLWSTVVAIFDNYCTGTLHNIMMQPNGLLYAGSENINLTWMDAMVAGKPVTPRYGFQVEINALWYNALCFINELAQLLDDPVQVVVTPLLPKLKAAFCATFWQEKLGYLYDFVNAEEHNADLRPNQIFAMSLPYSPLPRKVARQVLLMVTKQLYTTYGLRSLAKQSENYVVYNKCGNQEQRDLAYHNGAIWPWLLGHFGEAWLRVTSKQRAKKLLRPCLLQFKEHLSVAGVGSVSEIFSDNYAPDGCISQAWSVAELLRLTYMLDLDL